MEDMNMANTQTKDRRRHKRYYVKNRTFAVVRSENHLLDQINTMSKGEIALAVIKSNPPKMGEIIEISRGGLSFSYVENEAGLDHLHEMDILFVDEDFHLSRVLFKPIEDSVIEDDAPFNALSMKRLTVQFTDLTPKQKLKIEHFIKNFTTQEVPSLSGKQVWGSRS